MRRLTSSALLLLAASVAGCTNTQQVLEPSALVAPGSVDPAPQAQFPLAETVNPAAQSTQVAAITTDARIQFAPVIGATGDASTPLAARLSERATTRGINLVAAGDTSATHIMRGYFSTISDDGETTVIYVWDVLDPAGNRVHRFQGQAKSRGNGEGWASVQPDTMHAIADQTIDQLASWLVALQG